MTYRKEVKEEANRTTKTIEIDIPEDNSGISLAELKTIVRKELGWMKHRYVFLRFGGGKLTFSRTIKST